MTITPGIDVFRADHVPRALLTVARQEYTVLPVLSVPTSMLGGWTMVWESWLN